VKHRLVFRSSFLRHAAMPKMLVRKK
jgi:hypothetical protein